MNDLFSFLTHQNGYLEEHTYLEKALHKDKLERPPSVNQNVFQGSLRHDAGFGSDQRCPSSSRWVASSYEEKSSFIAANMRMTVADAEAGTVSIPNEDGTEDLAELW